MKRRTLLKSAAAAGGLFAMPTIARAQGARKKLTLIIGSSPPDPSCHVFYFANLKGFYGKENLDVEFKNLTNEATALRALVAGEGDVAGWCGSITGFDAMTAGAKIKCIGSFTPRTNSYLYANKSVADLKQVPGKTFAVSQVGAASQIASILALQKVGVDPKTVKWVGLGGASQRLNALVAKQVDVTLLSANFVTRADQYDYLHEVANLPVMLPDYLYTADYATIDAIQNKVEQMKSFMAATARAAKWALENPDEAAEVSRKVLPDATKEELQESMRAFSRDQFFNPSASVPKSAFDYTYGWYAANRTVNKPLTYDEFFTPYYAAVAAAAVKS